MAPPPLAVAEEARVTELPALPGGGLHGSPSWSELKALGGDAAEIESEGPVVVEAPLEVTLAAPPPSAVVEEERETELPASPGGGLHGSPSWLEPKAPGGDEAGTESERPVVAHATEVVDIPSDDKANDMVELLVSSRELAMV